MNIEEKMKKSASTQFVYLTVYCVICVLEIFVLSSTLLKILGIIGGTYLFVHTFCIKYNRKWLFANGLLSAFIVLQLGILLGKSLELETLITMGVVISLMDGISFTKAGKYTANGKAMSNVNFMSKLIVYGKGEGDMLYPTCGIGDFFYYALWITGLSALTDKLLYFVVGGILIIVGSSINSFIISKIYKKDNYKGIPATIIPFVCIIIEYVAICLLK